MIIKINGSSNLLQEAEIALIKFCLEASNGVRTQAASMLGITDRTLRNKINSYSELAAFRTEQTAPEVDLEKLKQLFLSEKLNVKSIAEFFEVSPKFVTTRLVEALGEKEYRKVLAKNRFENRSLQ